MCACQEKKVRDQADPRGWGSGAPSVKKSRSFSLSLSLTTTSDALDLFVLMMRGAVLKMIPEHGGLYCKKFGANIRGE